MRIFNTQMAKDMWTTICDINVQPALLAKGFPQDFWSWLQGFDTIQPQEQK